MNYPEYTLYTPGPTEIPKAIKDVLGICPPYYHGDSDFFNLMKDVVYPGLRYVFQTGENVYPLSCSGTGAMQIAASSLLDSGEFSEFNEVLVLNGGRFGQRWTDICREIGSDVDELYFSIFGMQALDDLTDRLKKKTYDIVFLQHVETSTGALLPVKEITRLIKEHNPGCLVVVDAISSLLVEQLHQDAWQIDCIVGASQKAFQLPSGLSFISFSEAAQKKAGEVRRHSQGGAFYFNLPLERDKYYQKGQTQFTPNIQCLVALARVFKLTGDLFDQWVRTAERKRALMAALSELGYEVDIDQRQTRGMVILFSKTPKDLRNFLKESYGCLIAGAPDSLSDIAVRISTMGWSVPDNHYINLLRGLKAYKELQK